jgi:hypothetical protein
VKTKDNQKHPDNTTKTARRRGRHRPPHTLKKIREDKMNKVRVESCGNIQRVFVNNIEVTGIEKDRILTDIFIEEHPNESLIVEYE